jgi:hypothetical protein
MGETVTRAQCSIGLGLPRALKQAILLILQQLSGRSGRMRPLRPGSDAQRQMLVSEAKSAGPVSEIDEFHAVDRRIPFILRLLQGKLQLLGAAYAAPHQDQPAKPNGYPGDHLDGRDGRQTDQQVDKRPCADEGARASSYDEPATAPNSLSQLVNLRLKSLDLLGWRRIRFEH